MKFNKIFSISLLIFCGSLYLECISVYAQLTCYITPCPKGGFAVAATHDDNGNPVCPSGTTLIITDPSKDCCCPIEKFPPPAPPSTKTAPLAK